MDLKLCYVDETFAYFTTQALDRQWGDGWNKAPYEHGAGAPYRYGKYEQEKNHPFWEVVRVAYYAPLETKRRQAKPVGGAGILWPKSMPELLPGWLPMNGQKNR